MPSVKEMTVLPVPAKSSAGDTRIQKPCQSCREELALRIEGILSLGICSEYNLMAVVP